MQVKAISMDTEANGHLLGFYMVWHDINKHYIPLLSIISNEKKFEEYAKTVCFCSTGHI